MTHVTCTLTAKNQDCLRNPTLGSGVWVTFTFLLTTKYSSIFTTKPVQRRAWTHKDHESHKLGVGAFAALASDDVPLLGRTDDDLRRHYLLLVQLMVASQLVHLNAVRAQTLQYTDIVVHKKTRNQV